MGSTQQRKREIYDNGNSAVILPYDPDRKTVLLTRQLRMPIFLQDGIERTVEACAGKLDGENAERRIVKEMEEELGYQHYESATVVRALCEPRRDHGKDRLLHLRFIPRPTRYQPAAGSRRRAKILM